MHEVIEDSRMHEVIVQGHRPELSEAELPEEDQQKILQLVQYGELNEILDRAYDQAANGKGKERHSNGLFFEDQPMQTISDLLGTNHGLLFQAMKKIQESTRMESDKAVHELLGAINYIAGAILYLEKKEKAE